MIQEVQHPCVMTEVINEIREEQTDQKIAIVTLTGEVTRLVSAVAELVDTQKKEEEYKRSQKDKKIDNYSDIIKAILFMLAGFIFSKM